MVYAGSRRGFSGQARGAATAGMEADSTCASVQRDRGQGRGPVNDAGERQPTNSSVATRGEQLAAG